MTRHLYRNTREAMVGGVCAGLADYLNLDPTIVRLIFILMALLGGHGILVYLILWLVVPPAPQAV